MFTNKHKRNRTPPPHYLGLSPKRYPFSDGFPNTYTYNRIHRVLPNLMDIQTENSSIIQCLPVKGQKAQFAVEQGELRCFPNLF